MGCSLACGIDPHRNLIERQSSTLSFLECPSKLRWRDTKLRPHLLHKLLTKHGSQQTAVRITARERRCRATNGEQRGNCDSEPAF